MLGNTNVRKYWGQLTNPIAKIFIKLGISSDFVTVFGTFGVVTVSVLTFPQGKFFIGSIFIGIFVLFDSIDGAIARLSGRNSKWGAFLDSVMDRIADGAFIGSIAIYYLNQDQLQFVILTLVALVASEIVSYTKARAESLGFKCDTGFGERAERIIITIFGTSFAGFGFPIVLDISIWVLAFVALFTVWQRIAFVYKQAPKY